MIFDIFFMNRKLNKNGYVLNASKDTIMCYELRRKKDTKVLIKLFQSNDGRWYTSKRKKDKMYGTYTCPEFGALFYLKMNCKLKIDDNIG